MQLGCGLHQLVRDLARRAGARPTILDLRSEPWASITFTGARHMLALRFEGDEARAQAARMCDGLDYAEFDLGVHILVDIEVADIADEDGAVAVSLEILTVEAD